MGYNDELHHVVARMAQEVLGKPLCPSPGAPAALGYCIRLGECICQISLVITTDWRDERPQRWAMVSELPVTPSITMALEHISVKNPASRGPRLDDY